MKYPWIPYLFIQLTLIEPGLPQDSNANIFESFYVKWIDQVSNFEEKSWLNIGLEKLLFGKKEQNLIKPFNIVTNGTNIFWIIDQGRMNLISVDSQEKEFYNYQLENEAGFQSLVGICTDAAGNIFFTDSGLNRIFLINKDSNTIRDLNDTLRLRHPTGIAFSMKTNRIWLSETHAHRLIMLDSKGNKLKIIGKRGDKPDIGGKNAS